MVWYKDIDLSHATERVLTDFRRHHVGFVFQFYNLIPSLTARENVSIVTDIARQPMDPADALALVGLEEQLAWAKAMAPVFAKVAAEQEPRALDVL